MFPSPRKGGFGSREIVRDTLLRVRRNINEKVSGKSGGSLKQRRSRSLCTSNRNVCRRRFRV